jgi:hypothetical protein
MLSWNFIRINSECKIFTPEFEKATRDETKSIDDIHKAIVSWARAIRNMVDKA